MLSWTGKVTSVNSKVPSAPVSVPFWDPSIVTVAAIIGCPLVFGHSAVYGVVRGGRRFGHGRGLPLGDDDAVSVDRAIDFLPREYLIENFADGGVLGRNGYAFVQIYLVRTDENGVVFGTVQRGHGLLNGYVLQFEIDSLCLSKTRGRAEQQQRITT